MDEDSDFLLPGIPELEAPSRFACFWTQSQLAWLWMTDRRKYDITKGRMAVRNVYDKYRTALQLNARELCDLDALVAKNRAMYTATLGVIRVQNLQYQEELRRRAVERGKPIDRFTESALTALWTPEDRDNHANLEMLATRYEMYLERRELCTESRGEYVGVMNQCMNTDSQLRSADHFVDIDAIISSIKLDPIIKMVEANTSHVGEVMDGVRELRGELADSNRTVNEEHQRLRKPRKPAGKQHARVLEDIFGPASDQPGLLPIPVPSADHLVLA